MIDIQHSNERNFCGAITPKEKDKIMKAILDMAAHERKTFCFTPNDVPNLKINGKQFEMVIMDFFEKGYIIKDTRRYRASTVSIFLSDDNIWSTDTSVSFETILIILAKISDLHMFFLVFILIFAMPHKKLDIYINKA